MTAPPGPIAYLTGEYPRATDTFIQREVAGLRALGWEVQTCSIRRTGPEHHVGPEQKAEAAATFNVIRAASSPRRLLRALGYGLRRPGRLAHTAWLAFRTRPPGTIALLWQVFYLVEALVLADELTRRGAVHLHNHIAKASCTVAMLASALSGIPYSFTLHGPDIFFAPEHWRLDAKIARAQFVACISHFCRSQAMAFSGAEDWQKLHIVHCGVDPARYLPRDHAEGAHLLFVGRLAGVKGLPVLFDALAGIGEVPGLRLTVVGDGPDRKALEARARTLPVPVAFTGYRSQDAVAALMGQADVFVLPSFAEGVPVVLMEAMAAGLPVVTTRIAGVPELVEDGVSGRLVAPGDAAALGAALREVLSDPERRAGMGRAGRAVVVEHFDAAGEAARLATIIAARHRGETPPMRPVLPGEAGT